MPKRKSKLTYHKGKDARGRDRRAAKAREQQAQGGGEQSVVNVAVEAEEFNMNSANDADDASDIPVQDEQRRHDEADSSQRQNAGVAEASNVDIVSPEHRGEPSTAASLSQQKKESQTKSLYPVVNIVHPQCDSDSSDDSDVPVPHQKRRTPDVRKEQRFSPLVQDVTQPKRPRLDQNQSDFDEIMVVTTPPQYPSSAPHQEDAVPGPAFPQETRNLFPVVEIIYPQVYSDSSDEEDAGANRTVRRTAAEIISQQRPDVFPPERHAGENRQVVEINANRVDHIADDLDRIEVVPTQPPVIPNVADDVPVLDVEQEVRILVDDIDMDFDNPVDDEYGVVEVVPVPVDENDDQRRNVRNDEILEERDNQNDVVRLRNNQGRRPTYLEATGRQVDPNHLGQMNRLCPHCSAKFFLREMTATLTYNKCCSGGKVVLPRLEQHPDVLRQLFKSQHPLSQEFRKNVIVYNNSFQFASLQANLRNIPGRGPFVYAIQGQLYHHYTDINVNRQNFKCGPLYFLDPEEATRQRVEDARHFNVDANLMRLIGEILGEFNPFAMQYRHLHEVYEQQRANNPQAVPKIGLEFSARRRDPRRREHDAPEVAEIAAVFEYDENEMPMPDMRVFLTDRDGAFRTISHEHELADALSFPLLFPCGDPGWNRNIPLANQIGRPNERQRVTLCQYYAYRFALRVNDDDERNFDVFRFGGKLTQKFVVAAYLKVEHNRVTYFRQRQDNIRAEEYRGLADHVRNMAEDANVPIGRMVILPSSFNTGPRSQMQRYQDAMAVVARVGYPSLFITMTCNPRWPEIVDNLPPNDRDPANHPMLTCRVFQMKLDALMEDLIDRQVMGISIAHIYVIEFQKRGLPHAHILLTLQNEDKPLDAERIDQLISAEIPDPEAERELFDLVGTHMIHGPCGQLNPGCVCMEGDRCVRNFPKFWYNNTTVRNGRVNYRRRRNGRFVQVRKGGQVFDVGNEFVVPYNPYLLLKYRTHINVEACTSARTVKYLYKYFFKGSDQAVIRVVEQHERPDQQQAQHGELQYDEITSFLNGRYMTPPEASWHLLMLPLHANSHHVERLPIHLPGRQHVVFRAGEERAAAERAENTKLLQWFETNRTDPYARQFLYTEFPLHYVWKQGQKRWIRRQRFLKPVIGRIFNVSLRHGELYYLRVLLLYVRGATSFEYLKTVNGRVCETFQEACRERGLLTEDAEWVRSLTEASERDMPKQLRQMFAYILVFGIVDDPPALWQRFRRFLIEDFLRRGMNEEEAERAALARIQFILAVNGKRLADFGLPEFEDFDRNQLIEDQFDADEERRQGDEAIGRLNADQRAVFDAVLRAVENDNEQRRLFFLRGAAGTGKTFLYNTLITCLNGRNIKVVAVAWTGLAAALLKGGRTAHSRFKLPLAMTEESTSSLTLQSEEAGFLREAKLIIWDEISMTTRIAFKIVDQALRFVCDSQLPFGGKCVIVGGDFKQCLPVVIGGDRTTIVRACVKSSPLWDLFEPVTLNINMRVEPNEQEFVGWLEQLGTGTLPPVDIPRAHRRDAVRVPDRCVVADLEQLIRSVFGDLRAGDVPNKAILTPLNETCHAINERIVESLGQDRPRVYISADSIEDVDRVDPDDFPMEFLNSLNPSGFPQHQLALREGCIVMLLKNLNVRANLCNGTRLLVRRLGDHYIEAEKIHFDGRLSGDVVFVPRVDFTSDSDRALPFLFRRRQFPVRTAYAVTINKAQGQTFDTVGIHLPKPVFEHGQLYVAFSRARRMDRVFVCVGDTTHQGRFEDNATYTKNIVYPEVL